jgi:hypothetical protein
LYVSLMPYTRTNLTHSLRITACLVR